MSAEPLPAPLPREQPMVVIAIVSFSSSDTEYLAECLKSLAASTFPRFRVVICENGGDAGFTRTSEAITGVSVIVPAEEHTIPCRHPRRDFRFAASGQAVTLFKAPANLGYAGGVNACIAAAGDDWDAVWVLNPDTFPEPDALAALVRRQRDGGYGMVGSRLIFVASGLVQTWGGIEWRRLLLRGRLLGANRPADTVPDIAEVERRIGFIIGASMYVTRAYIEAVGVMDDDFFVFNEDVDWCLRRGRFRLGYAHDSVVRHVHGATSGSSFKKQSRSRFNLYLSERNRVLLARKRFGRWWVLVALLALAQTSEHLLRLRSPRQFRIALDGWWSGIRGETGAPYFLREPHLYDAGAFRKAES